MCVKKIFIGLDQYNWKVGSPIKGKVNSRVKQDHPSNFHVPQNIFQPLFREYVIVYVMSDWRFGMTWGSCWDDYCVHQPPLQDFSQQGSLYISTSSNISIRLNILIMRRRRRRLKPLVTPIQCGSVARKPNSMLDDMTIRLFGPGVIWVAMLVAILAVTNTPSGLACVCRNSIIPESRTSLLAFAVMCRSLHAINHFLHKLLNFNILSDLKKCSQWSL